MIPDHDTSCAAFPGTWAQGMSLRDYFAAKIMAASTLAALTDERTFENFKNRAVRLGVESVDEAVAIAAYASADYMLKRREVSK